MYSQAISDPLVQFGYQYLGPFLLDWYNKLTAQLEPNNDPVFCLGREGWGLVPLFNTLESHRGSRRHYLYLPTSRGFLTHLSLSRSELLAFCVASRFTGSMRRFCEARLGVPYELLDIKIGADQVIVLPRDGEYLSRALLGAASILKVVADRSRIAYAAYLDKLGLSRTKLNALTDLGFRGTSQALLANIFGYDLKGYYAILDPAGVPKPLTLTPNSTVGLFSDTRSFGDDYDPLDRSLLLESLLTAPMGQLIGIQDQARGDPFLYRRGGNPQVNFGVVAACQQGAYKFAYDNMDLIGSNSPIIADLLPFFLEFRTSMKANLPLFEPALDIDDSYFGAAELKAEVAL